MNDKMYAQAIEGGQTIYVHTSSGVCYVQVQRGSVDRDKVVALAQELANLINDHVNLGKY